MQEMKCISAALTVLSFFFALFAGGFSFLAYMKPPHTPSSKRIAGFLVCILRQETRSIGDPKDADHFNRHATGLTVVAVLFATVGSLLALWPWISN